MKEIYFNKKELIGLVIIYLFLFSNALILKDNPVALISAFCGITYTMLAGKGYPVCYLFGVTGSVFYVYLAYCNSLWGNLLLYAGYYVPMQILGFFQWNKNLKDHKSEIVKTKLSISSLIKLILVTNIGCFICIYLLDLFNDKSPVIDGITTALSLSGMYLTVKRCIEQWVVWMFVNGLSLIMWLNIAISGEKVFSTVIMWGIYFILAIYFYIIWKKELNYDKRFN